jgi:hypothetical protein
MEETTFNSVQKAQWDDNYKKIICMDTFLMCSLQQNGMYLTFNLQLLPASVLIFDIHESPNHSGALKKTR